MSRNNSVKPFRVGWVWSSRTVPLTVLTTAPADAQAINAHQAQSRVADGGYEDVYTVGGKTQGIFRFRCVQGELTVVLLPSMEGAETSGSSVTGASLPPIGNPAWAGNRSGPWRAARGC